MGRYTEDGNYTRLGRIYHNMKTRCYNPNYDKYQYYGGKGITICDEWLNSYDAFEEWALNNGYAEDLTLDRINPNKNYCPDNCRWATRKEQANNRTSNHFITFNGKTKTVKEWSKEIGLSESCISQRLCSGWPIDRILTEANNNTNKKRMLSFRGETKRMCEWAKELCIPYSTLQNRINLHGWPVEKALTTPVARRS